MRRKYFLLVTSRTILILTFSFLETLAFAQLKDGAEKVNSFGGFVTATNNGISLIPTFSLGKPAVLFGMNVGRKLTFEPEFRFSMEGKPWVFIFWWRYKFIYTEKVHLTAGINPSMRFVTVPIITNGVTNEVIVINRNIALDLSPNYYLTKNISIGMYYLKSHSLQKNTIQNTDFITINSEFSHIKLIKRFYLKFKPQFYFLKMDDRHGFYFTSRQTLAMQDFPVSIESVINKEIDANILGSKNFVWNISLIYSYGKKYVERKL